MLPTYATTRSAAHPYLRTNRLAAVLPVITLLVLVNLGASVGQAARAGVVHISISRTGGTSNGDVYGANPVMSRDGRFVAFQSLGSDLVAGDTNRKVDVFVRDRDTDGDGIFDEPAAMRTTRVSVSSAGAEGNGESTTPAISANGRFIAFRSVASNLVAGDTNANAPDNGLGQDVFVHDRLTSATTRVSVSGAGAQGDKDSGGIEGYGIGVSADARWVAFGSHATNLASNDVNQFEDVFVHDRETGATTRVSFASGRSPTRSGVEFRAISPDGRWIVMRSAGFLATEQPGHFIYVHDRDPDQDAVFDETDAYSLALVSRRDDGVLANADSYGASISADGRIVAFYSTATNLVPGDTNSARDLFVHDRDTDTDGVYDEIGSYATTRASVSTAGAEANDQSGENANPGISWDGRFLTFSSLASNLAVDDTASSRDTFVHDRAAGATALVSLTSSGGHQNGPSYYQSISGNGGFVAFASASTNLVATDTSPNWDVFVAPRDAKAPDTSITSGPAEFIQDRAASFTFTSNEDDVTFHYSLDGAAFKVCSSPLEVSNLAAGAHTLLVRAADVSNNVDATPARYSWTVDRTAPVVTVPAHRFAAGRSAVATAVPVTLSWSATDPAGVAAYQLQQRDPAGSFVDITLRSATAVNHTLLLSQEPHRFQVRAQDGATNWSAYRQGPEFTLVAVQQDDGAITFTRTWQTKSVTNAFGGSVKASRAKGAAARYRFTGRHIAWIATRGPDRGLAEVWLDGAAVAKVDLYAATTKPAVIVWTRSRLRSSLEHSVEIRVLGAKREASSGAWVDLDGFGVLR